MEYIEIKKENTKLLLKDLKRGDLFKFVDLECLKDNLLIRTSTELRFFRLCDSVIIEVHGNNYLYKEVKLYEQLEPIKVREI